jgi:hypothetical protein
LLLAFCFPGYRYTELELSIISKDEPLSMVKAAVIFMGSVGGYGCIY